MKALGIDFGEKRIGLAISDADGRFAMPWKTLARRNDQQAIEELGEIAAQESIDLIVAGDPRNLDGDAGPQSERVAAFLKKLSAALDLPIETVNESLTSREAHSRLRQAGLTARQRRERVDSLAAQILLQEALDRRRRADPA
ncbi:MAG: Holliday junction resolvase RuvX [bacterium]|nr:Holliday junction resolvase RuvX [bacterium]